ncbi:MAG: phage terminase small subunit [Victivallaceae bacterium]|nr:phage terminase small subunit [Victivallaceae bacterium]
MGLAFKHHDTVMAQNGAAAVAAPVPAAGAAAELRLADLAAKRDAVHAAPQGATRDELKRKFIAELAPEVEAYLASGVPAANPVLVWAMIWSFDAGDMAFAMRLAERAVAEKQEMPHPPFRNTFRVDAYVADAVFERSEAAFKSGGDPEPYFAETFARVLDGTYRVHDVVKAKYCKLAALMLEAKGEVERALGMAANAAGFGGDKAQVKTLISRLEKAVAAKREQERYKG